MAIIENQNQGKLHECAQYVKHDDARHLHSHAHRHSGSRRTLAPMPTDAVRDSFSHARAHPHLHHVLSVRFQVPGEAAAEPHVPCRHSRLTAAASSKAAT